MSENKTIIYQMDKKLWEQLKRYSDHNDLSIAQTARKAIKKFIQEEKDYAK